MPPLADGQLQSNASVTPASGRYCSNIQAAAGAVAELEVFCCFLPLHKKSLSALQSSEECTEAKSC